MTHQNAAPCDWVVVMRRMPADRRLSALLSIGEDVSDAVRAVARLLAVHHAGAPALARGRRAVHPAEPTGDGAARHRTHSVRRRRT